MASEPGVVGEMSARSEVRVRRRASGVRTWGWALVLWLVVAAVAPVGESRALPPPGRAETSTSRLERGRLAPERRGSRREIGPRGVRSRRGSGRRRGPLPNGRLARLPGSSTTHGNGDVFRFVVEVERHLRTSRRTFLRRVEETLFSERGWLRSGNLAFRRARRAPIDFRVILASRATTDRLCAPALTHGRFSCHNNGLVVINAWRWRKGAPAYRGLSRYRTYVINHEVGHALGHGHLTCSGGRRAPVMMQQTMGVGSCRAHPWPLRSEVGGTGH